MVPNRLVGEWIAVDEIHDLIGCQLHTLRQGQPWQADLETHVANWRATAGPYPLEWCVLDLMGPGKVLGNGWYLMVVGGDYWCCGFVKATDPATAIKRAACIVKLRKRGE